MGASLALRMDRNRKLTDRLGGALARKTGIPSPYIIVREPMPRLFPRPEDSRAGVGEVCGLCGRSHNPGTRVKRVIVQDERRPVATMFRMALCSRTTACLVRTHKDDPQALYALACHHYRKMEGESR